MPFKLYKISSLRVFKNYSWNEGVGVDTPLERGKVKVRMRSMANRLRGVFVETGLRVYSCTWKNKLTIADTPLNPSLNAPDPVSSLEEMIGSPLWRGEKLKVRMRSIAHRSRGVLLGARV